MATFPFAASDSQDLLIGLFTSHVHEVFLRKVAEAYISQPLGDETQVRYMTLAILEVATWFPPSVRNTCERHAEAMATEMVARRPMTAG